MNGLRRLLLVPACVAVLSLGGAANAESIYDNVSASTGATSGGDASIAPPSSGPLADSFSTGGGASMLTDVKLLIRAMTPTDGGSFTVSLLSDSSTSPGSVLTTFATVQDSSLTTSLGVYDYTLSTPYALAANTRYWIELGGSSTSGRWSFDNTNVGVGVANEYNYFSGTTFANSSFTPYQMQVNVSHPASVPEPASLGLCVFGFAAAAIARRRLARH